MRETILALFSLIAAVFSLFSTAKNAFSLSNGIKKSFAALKSQANALTFIFLSGLILGQSLIIAYNFTNSSMPSGDNLSGNLLTGFAVSPPDFGDANANVSFEGNMSGETNSSPVGIMPVIEIPGNLSANESIAPENFSSPYLPGVTNDTLTMNDSANDTFLFVPENSSEIIPDTNVTGPANITFDENVSANISFPFPAPETNGSLTINITPELNFTQPVNGTPEANTSQANLEVSASIGATVERGQLFALTVKVSNTGAGDAKNVAVSFDLPPKVLVFSGDPDIGAVPAGAAIEREFIMQPTYDSNLGANKIRVRVSYE